MVININPSSLEVSLKTSRLIEMEKREREREREKGEGGYWEKENIEHKQMERETKWVKDNIKVNVMET